MFQIINDVTYINGQNGKYDNKIKNNTARYARNAISNYTDTYSPMGLKNYAGDLKSPKAPKLPQLNKDSDNPVAKLINNLKTKIIVKKVDKYAEGVEKYLQGIDKELDSMPTPGFNLKYAQTEAGKIDSIAPVAAAYEELGKQSVVSVNELTKTIQKAVSPDLADKVSAKALDLNKDGNVDIGEYASSILVEDMISSSTSGQLKASDVNGEITNKGQTELLAFASEDNYQSANNIFSKVYSDFNLSEAAEKFAADKNNLVE